MSGSGKGGNNRRYRQNYSGRRDDTRTNKPDSGRPKDKKPAENLFAEGKFGKENNSPHERPLWIAPKIPAGPLPVPDCPWCGKPIRDLSTAISDKVTGSPLHFDCVIARINESEAMEQNDAICYIGGGRFGVIHYNNPPDIMDFKIKKIFEWENKENRNEWRQNISEHYSVT